MRAFPALPPAVRAVPPGTWIATGLVTVALLLVTAILTRVDVG